VIREYRFKPIHGDRVRLGTNSTRKYFGYLERTRYGPLYNRDNRGFDASSLIKTCEQVAKLEGIWSGFVAGTAE